MRLGKYGILIWTSQYCRLTLGSGIRLGTVLQADSPETSVVFQCCGGMVFYGWGLFVRREAAQAVNYVCLEASCEKLWAVHQATGARHDLLTNHMRENETCNGRKWTTNGHIRSEVAYPIVTSTMDRMFTNKYSSSLSCTQLEFREACLTPQVLPA